MAIDSTGFVHVAGNMHNVPLIYYRSTRALDASSLARVTSMVGSNEQSVTYPEFFQGPTGNLVFIYRDGGSGNGNHIFNTYDTGTRAWRRLLGTPLTDGQGQRNAYPVGPVLGPDGFYHLVWVWRDTPDAATNHDLSYAKSRDLVQWQSAAGTPLTLPVTLATSDIVDPVPSGGGMINNNTKVGFDSQNRAVVVYHKYDSAGNTQLYNARFEGGRWVRYQTSMWNYRWAFGGDGTLVFEIEVAGVKVQPDGTLTQDWYTRATAAGARSARRDQPARDRDDRATAPLPARPGHAAINDRRDGRAVGSGHRGWPQRERPLHAALGDARIEPRHATRSDPAAHAPASLRLSVVRRNRDHPSVAQHLRCATSSNEACMSSRTRAFCWKGRLGRR